MKLHILGACGTFMAGIAYIARQLGFEVIGIDQNVYPPMSDFLRNQGIELISGYENVTTLSQPDMVIIGNAMSRGNPAVEHVLNQRWNYISGPQWLYENVLRYKKVLAVSGTHGKTTTSSILTWILEHAGLNPGFLIGGMPNNFDTSARVTDSDYFVIEADEYDTAFFDKRSKFVHYHPDVLIINNIEFDHADIFANLAEIKKQFHILLRTVPSDGVVIYPAHDEAIADLFTMGMWSQAQSFGFYDADVALQGPSQMAFLGNGHPCPRAPYHPWFALPSKMPSETDLSSSFQIRCEEEKGRGFQELDVSWSLLGDHNILNALAAIAAAYAVGVDIPVAVKALAEFKNVKRRLEKIAQVGSIEIYEDFAHHPTAIKTTLNGLRRARPQGRLIALLELASNTMKAGVHKESLVPSLQIADEAYILQTKTPYDFLAPADAKKPHYSTTVDEMISHVVANARENDTIIIMSNKDFGDIYKKLPAALFTTL